MRLNFWKLSLALETLFPRFYLPRHYSWKPSPIGVFFLCFCIDSFTGCAPYQRLCFSYGEISPPKRRGILTVRNIQALIGGATAEAIKTNHSDEHNQNLFEFGARNMFIFKLKMNSGTQCLNDGSRVKDRLHRNFFCSES